MILKAIRFAELKHKGQKRKVSGEDYISHPIFVSYKAANFKKSKHFEELIIASILHDVVEDTDTTFQELVEEFGMFVASLVFELTNDEEEIKKVGKFEYQKSKMYGMSNYALFLKFCDRLCNILDNPTEKYVNETSEILKYINDKRKITKSQYDIMCEILAEINKFKENANKRI